MIGNVLKQLGGPKYAAKAEVYRSLIDHHVWETRESGPIALPTDDPRTYFRASGLPGACPRAESIKIVNGIAVVDQVVGETGLVYALGHHHHSLMQDSVAPAIVGDRMRGWWSSGSEVLSPVLAPGRPELIGSPGPGWRYREVHAYSVEHKIQGHPDLVIDWSGSKIVGVPDGLEVQEYKSKDQVSWAKIDPDQGGYPDPRHMVQVQVYMWLLGIQHGRIVYIKKGERRPASAFVEWAVLRDDNVLDIVLESTKKMVSAIRGAREDGKVYAERLPACSNFAVGRALECPLRYECHSRPWRKTRTDIRVIEDYVSGHAGPESGGGK